MEGQSGTEYTLFLGCAAAAAHSPGSASGWLKDSHTGPGILADGTANSGNTLNLPDIQAGTITALYILFDEGTDQGPGYVYLDNISVNGKVFTGPMDNGNH